MAIADFTSPDDIRAALGVSATELPDTVVSLPLYENGLAMDLRELHGQFAETFAAALAKDDANRTDGERHLLLAGSLFAIYAVARHLGVTLPMFGPKQISDGRASMVRFSQDPYQRTLERVEALFLKYRQTALDAVVAVLGAGTDPVPLRPYLAIVTPSSDPVTGT